MSVKEINRQFTGRIHSSNGCKEFSVQQQLLNSLTLHQIPSS